MTRATTPTTTRGAVAATTRDGTPGRRLLPSVRARITAAVAVLVGLALAASGLLVYLLGLDRVDDTVVQAVAQEIAELEQFEEDGVDPETGVAFSSVERLVEEFLERNVPAPSEVMLGVWGGAVRMASESAREALRRDPVFLDAVLPRVADGGSAELETRWGTVYVEVLPVRDARRAGAFVVAYFVDDERAPLHQTMRSYAVAALLALVVVTAVAAWQAGRLLAPVRTLRETAEEITATDLSRRIPVTGNDDISDLTRTVNAMLDRLDRAFAGQRAFLDDAGHELRTPLTIIRGHLELLDATSPTEVDRTRDLLVEEVDRMARLVEDMILLTKAERPGFVHRVAVHPGDLVRSVAEKARGLGERDWRVEGDAVVHRGDPVDLDEQRITQALVQLAHNAVKHTALGDTVAIGASLGTGRHDWLHLWVRDTGSGVPDPDKEAIFARFARGTDASDPDGAGLGLSIVAAIARAHSGTVHVEDAAPRGARFVLTLPRTRKEPLWPAS